MKVAKIIIVALMALALSTPVMAGGELSQNLVASAEKWSKKITPAELKKKIDNEDDIYMLDVREPYMIPEGSIEGMENVAIPRGLLEFEIEDKIPNKDAFIVIYCRAGKGAALSAKTLKEDMHYTNAHYLVGGLDSWLEAGYSVFSSFGEVKLAK